MQNFLSDVFGCNSQIWVASANFMSWLNLRKKEPAPAAAPKREVTPKKLAVASAPVESPQGGAHAAVLLRPHVTEKGADASMGVYAFEVARGATKRQIAAAVQGLYNVAPRKVAVLPITRKQVVVRGRRGVKGGGKKAYIYLKKGEKIEVV